MPEPALIIVLLAVAVACLVAVVTTALLTARDFRRTLRRINGMLPEADRALREARHSLEGARQLLARADTASRRVEGVVHDACDAVSGTLSQVTLWRKRASRFLKEHVGNGAGADPRRHHRRR